MPKGEDDETESDTPEPQWERINEAKALWTRSRSDVSDDEYKEFYRHVSSDYQDPLSWSHNRVEGKLDYTSLLYIPSQAPFDLWNREGARGLSSTFSEPSSWTMQSSFCRSICVSLRAFWIRRTYPQYFA